MPLVHAQTHAVLSSFWNIPAPVHGIDSRILCKFYSNSQGAFLKKLFIAKERRSKLIYIPYILESNPHPFYSFRGLKNQMWIRIA